MIKKLTILWLVIFVTGCAAVKSSKPIPVDYKYAAPVKIGYISMISEKPAHSHIGLTVFGNFEKDLEVSWHLNEFIFQTLASEMKTQKGYELVNLSAMNGAELFYENPNLLQTKGDFRVINDAELKGIINKIGSSDLDAIIIIRSPKLFYNAGFQCLEESRGRPGDHGFKSRALEGVTFNSMFAINMFSIMPKSHFFGGDFIGLAGKVSPEPADYEKITNQELANYESQLKNTIKSRIASFVLKMP